MNGFDLYKMHMGFNLHFSNNTDYCFFKYHGSVRVNESTYNKNKFRWQFETLAKKIEQFGMNPITIMYRLFKSYDFKYVPLSYGTIKTMNSILYGRELELNEIESDMRFLLDKYKTDMDQLTKCVDSLYPTLYNLYHDESIGLETLILYDSYVSRFLVPGASKDIILWPAKLKKFESVRGFIESIISRKDFNDIMERLV